jgi:hypothetical protein
VLPLRHLLAALLLLVAPLATRAAETAQPGSDPVVGLRISGGVPWGELTSDTFPVRQQLVYVTSFAGEGSWRLSPRWDAGLTIDVGHAPIAPTICPARATCWGWLGRAAVLVRLHLSPRSSFDPWVAAGAGLTVADVRIVTTSQRWQGFEALRLEGGFAFLRRERYGLGLFLSASLDRFTHEVIHARGLASESAPLRNRSWHGWVTAGIRGTFEPPGEGAGP